MSMFRELSRRNVIRVGIAYLIGAWVIIQVADVVLENIGAPGWVVKTILLILGLGFPITLIFSWAYEVTPEGIKRESEVDRSASITSVTGRKLDRAIIVLLAVALAYFVWESRIASPPGSADNENATSELSIAVLPFESRSSLEEDEFFTDGMHDDLLTTIANIGSLKVISRTSVMEYKDTIKKIPEIARELGVANILEGAVQRSGNKVRINMQLIDAETDEHIWAEIYDRELTAENLFAIQTEISTAIAEALHATLSPDEQRRISTLPTTSLEASDAYWRGRQLIETREAAKLEQAVTHFERAVEIDPQFALAWVGIADAYNHLASYGSLRNDQTFDVRQESLDKALAIDPGLGQVHASIGALQRDRGQWEDGIASLEKAIELGPNYATAHHWLSFFLSGDFMRLHEALRIAKRAAELDPHSSVIGTNLAQIYLIMGRYEEAIAEMDRVLSFDPGFAYGHIVLGNTYTDTGALDKALGAYRKAVEFDPKSPYYHMLLVGAYVRIGAVGEARIAFTTMREAVPGHLFLRFANLRIQIAEQNEDNVNSLLQLFIDRNDSDQFTYIAIRALAYIGDIEAAAGQLQYLNWLDDQDRWGERIADLADSICGIAWLLRQSGDEDRAVRFLEDSLHFYEDIAPANIDHVDSYHPELCYLLSGDTEQAIAIIEQQYEHGHIGNFKQLHALMIYDAIRDDPRFVMIETRLDSRLAELRRAAGL